MLDWNYACERFLISLGDSRWGIIAIILMLVFNPLSFRANGVENLIAGGYSVREAREHKGKWCEERKLREEEPWRAEMLLILAGEMFVCQWRVWLHVGCCVAAEAGVSFWMIFQNACSCQWEMHFELSDLCRNQSQFLFIMAIYLIRRNAGQITIKSSKS